MMTEYFISLVFTWLVCLRLLFLEFLQDQMATICRYLAELLKGDSPPMTLDKHMVSRILRCSYRQRQLFRTLPAINDWPIAKERMKGHFMLNMLRSQAFRLEAKYGPFSTKDILCPKCHEPQEHQIEMCDLCQLDDRLRAAVRGKALQEVRR